MYLVNLRSARGVLPKGPSAVSGLISLCLAILDHSCLWVRMSVDVTVGLIPILRNISAVKHCCCCWCDRLTANPGNRHKENIKQHVDGAVNGLHQLGGWAEIIAEKQTKWVDVAFLLFNHRGQFKWNVILSVHVMQLHCVLVRFTGRENLSSVDSPTANRMWRNTNRHGNNSCYTMVWMNTLSWLAGSGVLKLCHTHAVWLQLSFTNIHLTTTASMFNLFYSIYSTLFILLLFAWKWPQWLGLWEHPASRESKEVTLNN